MSDVFAEEPLDSSSCPCACKGIRTCLICEESGRVCYSGDRTWNQTYEFSTVHGGLIRVENSQLNCKGQDDVSEIVDCNAVNFEGVHLIEKFITLDEESSLVKQIDASPWKDSQSGRRKQASAMYLQSIP